MQGRPAASRNNGGVAEVHTVVLSDWCMIIGHIAKKIGISYRFDRAFERRAVSATCVCEHACHFLLRRSRYQEGDGC